MCKSSNSLVTAAVTSDFMEVADDVQNVGEKNSVDLRKRARMIVKESFETK